MKTLDDTCQQACWLSDDKSQTRVYIAEITDISESELASFIAQLPLWRKEKTLAIKHLQGRKESAVSFVLLEKALHEHFSLTEEIAFEYNEHGKPSLKNHPEIHFNLSHCRSVVACAISENPVGIDVEMLGRYKESVARHVLSDEEYSQVVSSENPDIAFTILWTKKEALLKLIGTGVSGDMKDVLALNADKKITTTICDGYVYSVAE